MYRLVLKLPFNVTLVYKEVFETIEAAEVVQATLEQGFEVMPEADIDMSTADIVPMKERDEDRRSTAMAKG